MGSNDQEEEQSEISDEDEENEDDFEFSAPKSLRCVAHTLQLCLKDVFDSNSAMKALKTY